MSEPTQVLSPREDVREPLALGLDVGSTTVKVVAMRPDTQEVLFREYQRHHTRQPEKLLEMLKAVEALFPNSPKDKWTVFATGSGAGPRASCRK